MKIAIIVASTALALAPAASANDSLYCPHQKDCAWYLLDAPQAKCRNLAATYPSIPSPYAYETALRSAGQFKNTEVSRGGNDKIFMVAITDQNGVLLIFFPAKELCEAGLQGALKGGFITKPDDLK